MKGRQLQQHPHWARVDSSKVDEVHWRLESSCTWHRKLYVHVDMIPCRVLTVSPPSSKWYPPRVSVAVLAVLLPPPQPHHHPPTNAQGMGFHTRGGPPGHRIIYYIYIYTYSIYGIYICVYHVWNLPRACLPFSRVITLQLACKWTITA